MPQVRAGRHQVTVKWDSGGLYGGKAWQGRHYHCTGQHKHQTQIHTDDLWLTGRQHEHFKEFVCVPKNRWMWSLGFQPSLLVCQNILINVSSIARDCTCTCKRIFPSMNMKVYEHLNYMLLSSSYVSSHIMFIFYFSGVSLRWVFSSWCQYKDRKYSPPFNESQMCTADKVETCLRIPKGFFFTRAQVQYI